MTKISCKHQWSNILDLTAVVCMLCGVRLPSQSAELNSPATTEVEPDIEVSFDHLTGLGTSHYEWGIFHHKRLIYAGCSHSRMVAELEYTNALKRLRDEIGDMERMAEYYKELAQNQQEE